MKIVRVLLFAAISSASFANTIVVPNGLDSTPGGTALPVGSNASREQIVFGNGQFKSLTGPITIDSVSFRAATGTGPLVFDDPSFQVTLSTTSVYPNDKNGHQLIGTTFNDNIGPNATVVYNAPLVVNDPGCGTGVCPFDVTISFQTPFTYNPLNGQLLMDITSAALIGTPSGSLDGVSVTDPTTSVEASVGGSPDSPTGTLSLSGPVVEIDFSPEPSSAWLLGTGAAAVLWLMNRRRKAVAGAPPSF